MAVFQLFAHGRLLCQGHPGQTIESLHPAQVDDLSPWLADFTRRHGLLQAVPVDALVGWLDAAAHQWSQRDHPLQQQLGPFGLNFLLYWFQRQHLIRMLDLNLRGQRHVLDGFHELPHDPSGRLYRAHPRGVAVHWLAGNAPLLGMLSCVQGLLAKNLNILKVPSEGSVAIPLVLDALRSVSYRAPDGVTVDGQDITQTVAALYADRTDEAAQARLSREADVRIAWGGREAMEAIGSLPKSPLAEDVMFGPKYSYAVIGREMLSTPASAAELAHRLAIDASLFDQYACSSPHTVCVEEGGRVTPREFAQLLAKAMAEVLPRIPRHGVTPAEASAIVGVRAEYELTGEVLAPSTTDWTVIFAPTLEGLAPPCHGRVVFVRPMADILLAADLASPLTQTVGVALAVERRVAFAERATARGVVRCPAIGQMNVYETPWDGMFVVDRLVRWVTVTSEVKDGL